jgi:hypothetical protein
MVDRRGVCTGFAVMLLATPALAASTFGEVCSGSEVLQVGSQPARTVPYHLEFSADLQTRSYCYGACGKNESYPISDPTSKPIVLTNIHVGSTVRYLTFDPQTSRVEDYQSIDAGLVVVKRQASASCTAAAFHEPAPQGDNPPTNR